MRDITKFVTPVHTGTVNGLPIRFFETPLDDGRPDYPWHSVDDLMTALQMGDVIREYFLRHLRTVSNATVKSIATNSGIIQVSPHYMAQGTIDAMLQIRFAQPQSRREYDIAGAKALSALTEHLSFPDEVVPFCRDAMNRWSDNGEAE